MWRRYYHIILLLLIIVGIVLRLVPLAYNHGYPICVDCYGRLIITKIYTKHRVEPFQLLASYLLDRAYSPTCITNFTYPYRICLSKHVTPLPELLIELFGEKTSIILLPLLGYFLILGLAYYYTRRSRILQLVTIGIVSLGYLYVARLGFGNVDDTCIGIPLLVASIILYIETFTQYSTRRRRLVCMLGLAGLNLLLILDWHMGLILGLVSPFILLVLETFRQYDPINPLLSMLALTPVYIYYYYHGYLQFLVIGLALHGVALLPLDRLGRFLQKHSSVKAFLALLVPLTIILIWVWSIGLPHYQYINLLTPARTGLKVVEELPPTGLVFFSTCSILPLLYLYYLYDSDSFLEKLYSIVLLVFGLDYVLFLPISMLVLVLDQDFQTWFNNWYSRLGRIEKISILLLSIAPLLAWLLHPALYTSPIVLLGHAKLNITSPVVDSWSLGYYITYLYHIPVLASPLTVNTTRIRLIEQLYNTTIGTGQYYQLLKKIDIPNSTKIYYIVLVEQGQNYTNHSPYALCLKYWTRPIETIETINKTVKIIQLGTYGKYRTCLIEWNKPNRQNNTKP